MKRNKMHRITRRSNFMTIVIKSLLQGKCTCCGKHVELLSEINSHWKDELEKTRILRGEVFSYEMRTENNP